MDEMHNAHIFTEYKARYEAIRNRYAVISSAIAQCYRVRAMIALEFSDFAELARINRAWRYIFDDQERRGNNYRLFAREKRHLNALRDQFGDC